MSFTDDIAQYLTFPAWGLGLNLDINLFIDRMPETPNTCTVIYTTQGRAPERIQESNNLAYGHPRAQIACRSEVDDPQPAKILCFQIYELLGGVHNTWINGVSYKRLDMLQEPFVIGPDGNQRYEYCFNIEAFKDA